MSVWDDTLQVTIGEWYIRVPNTVGGVNIALEFLKLAKKLLEEHLKNEA